MVWWVLGKVKSYSLCIDTIRFLYTEMDITTDLLCFILDKSIIVWSLLRDETNYGIPKRALKGHNHFVSDVVISSDGQFALSGSWDSTLRLWELSTGQY